MSLDNLPEDTLPADIELLKEKYRLDNASVEALSLIMKKIPLGDLATHINDDFFVRELLPLTQSREPAVKLRSLELLFKWLTTNKKKAKSRRINLGADV